jgi:hypothetical protein
MKKEYVKLVEDTNAKGSPRVSYSAIVLTDKSHDQLLNHFHAIHPEVFAHHMTIKMGPLEGEDRSEIGKTVKLRVISKASDDKVQAVGVQQMGGPKSQNKIPHITISVNRENGGKPFLSNKLTNWERIDNVIDLEGIVTEVTS